MWGPDTTPSPHSLVLFSFSLLSLQLSFIKFKQQETTKVEYLKDGEVYKIFGFFPPIVLISRRTQVKEFFKNLKETFNKACFDSLPVNQ